MVCGGTGKLCVIVHYTRIWSIVPLENFFGKNYRSSLVIAYRCPRHSSFVLLEINWKFELFVEISALTNRNKRNLPAAKVNRTAKNTVNTFEFILIFARDFEWRLLNRYNVLSSHIRLVVFLYLKIQYFALSGNKILVKIIPLRIQSKIPFRSTASSQQDAWSIQTSIQRLMKMLHRLFQHWTTETYESNKQIFIFYAPHHDPTIVR